MNCPLVSVVIPTKDRYDLVKGSIENVRQQSYSNLEIVIVEDGSKSGISDYISNLNDNRIKYFRQDDCKGLAVARNVGVNIAKGKLVAFLDDDDEWLDTKLEKQVPLLQRLPSSYGMVYCWMDYYSNGNLIYEHHPILRGLVFLKVLETQRLGGCPTLLVRKEVFEKIGLFNESLTRGNDGDFIRRVSQKYEVDYLPEVLVKVNAGHGYDRISSNDVQGVVNAIRSQREKLKKFREELYRYPYQASNIYTAIAFDYGVIMKWGECILYYIKAVSKFPFNINIYRKIMVSIRMFILYLIKR